MSDPLKEKAFAFALRIVKLSEFLQKERREFSLSKKVLDSGVNIGLFIEEARQGDDRNEFRLKYSIANKDAFKTNYFTATDPWWWFYYRRAISFAFG